jgi:hypothetical protein
MNTDELSAELLGLAQTDPADPTRSKAARLRAVLPAVEAALAGGASHSEVLVKLHAHGIDMSLAVFGTTLRRERARRAKEGPAPPAAALTPAPAAVPRPVAAPAFRDPAEPKDMDDLIKYGKGSKA